MAEQDQTETKSGIGFSGVVGGVGAGVATVWQADKQIARRGIANALAGSDKAKGFAEPTAALVKAEPTFVNTQRAITQLKGLEAVNGSVKSMEFTANEGGKGYTAVVKTQAVGYGPEKLTIHNVAKLPEGIQEGVAITEKDELEKLVVGEKASIKTLLQQAEKDLITDIRKAGGRGFGFSKVSGMGKAGIIVGTVAGAVVGAKAVHAIFGGKHSNQVAANDTDRTQETAAAR